MFREFPDQREKQGHRDPKAPPGSRDRGERAESPAPRVTRAPSEWTACPVLPVKRDRRATLAQQVYQDSPDPEDPKAYLAHLVFRAPREQPVNPGSLVIKESADLRECPEVPGIEAIQEIPDRREREDCEDPLETPDHRDPQATEDLWEREVFPEMSETPDHRERKESRDHVGGEVNPDLPVNQAEWDPQVPADPGVLWAGQAWTACRDQ